MNELVTFRRRTEGESNSKEKMQPRGQGHFPTQTLNCDASQLPKLKQANEYMLWWRTTNQTNSTTPGWTSKPAECRTQDRGVTDEECALQGPERQRSFWNSRGHGHMTTSCNTGSLGWRQFTALTCTASVQ